MRVHAKASQLMHVDCVHRDVVPWNLNNCARSSPPEMVLNLSKLVSRGLVIVVSALANIIVALSAMAQLRRLSGQ